MLIVTFISKKLKICASKIVYTVLSVGLILLFNLEEQPWPMILIGTFVFCVRLLMAVLFHHTSSFFLVVFFL